MGLYVFFQRIVDRVCTLQTIRCNFIQYQKQIYVNHIEMIKFRPKIGFNFLIVYLYVFDLKIDLRKAVI